MLSTVHPTHDIKYDAYEFKKTTYVIDVEGNIDNDAC